jgi:hypothetical protein
MAIETGLAWRIKPSVPVVSLLQHKEIFGAIVIVEQPANTCRIGLSDQYLTAGRTTPAVAFDKIYVFLAAIVIEVDTSDFGNGQHLIFPSRQDVPMTRLEKLMKAANLIRVEHLRKPHSLGAPV